MLNSLNKYPSKSKIKKGQFLFQLAAWQFLLAQEMNQRTSPLIKFLTMQVKASFEKKGLPNLLQIAGRNLTFNKREDLLLILAIALLM